MSLTSHASLINPNPTSTIDIDDVTHFLLELDALKRVNRRSYVTGTTRLENSAEHSWHLAMACWSIAEQFELDVNYEQLLKMALIHDLGEVDAGDTFLFANSRDDAHAEEREGIARLQAERGNGINNLSEVWEAQETGSSKEAELLRVVDRILPFLLNLNTGGKTWSEHDVTRSQVIRVLEFIKDSFPTIHVWLSKQIDYATQQGWLIDA
ncbi:HD domain-containing protein [Psychrobacter sp. AOP22-C1-22]|uniref:HD domain-containing protein n=1 Tax=unclassified Psychrobacter TaxID=196806 RepID=UPI0017888C20|nr:MULTISPECIES: HD domain-containing protein [unclassified Psychrobacter]MDN5802607.1 HD domain-containing protein [Psychrobacter sp.]MBE0407659.1 HD domain-containing protein [Psychrobacter sp. FME6]MBE0445751.1 HD domain-containing protein [Psychrobacter sp. FME5]MDN5890803.1 HD domain-containing protein [Psychrobacter sp.]MDN5897080.1 HD domain-containing protein [Psychrobacter sp.]